MDVVELGKDIAETDELITVVETQQHLETGTGILEIFVLMVFKVLEFLHLAWTLLLP